MTVSILTALSNLQTAAGSVSGLEVFALNQTVIPPGVVFGLPTLEAETFHSLSSESGITTATFDAYLIVAIDGFEVENLLGFVDALVQAIESQTHAVVLSLTAGSFVLDGGPQLPSYALSIAYPL